MVLETKKLVAANVKRLLEHRGGPLTEREKSGVARLIALGVSNGNATRALGGEADLRLGTLDEIAHGFRIKPWQLLVPDLDPANLPSLAKPGGSSNEPASHEHHLTDSRSEDAVRSALRDLDSAGQALAGDILKAMRRRLAPPGEKKLRDPSWSNEKAESAVQVAERPAKGKK